MKLSANWSGDRSGKMIDNPEKSGGVGHGQDGRETCCLKYVRPVGVCKTGFLLDGVGRRASDQSEQESGRIGADRHDSHGGGGGWHNNDGPAHSQEGVEFAMIRKTTGFGEGLGAAHRDGI